MSASDRRTFNRAVIRHGAAQSPEIGTDPRHCGSRARLRRLGALALASALSVGVVQLAEAQDAAPAPVVAPAPAPTTPAPVVETTVTAPAPSIVTLEPPAERAAEP